MSAAIIPARITVEEFLLRPERTDGFQEELIEGVIYVSPSAKPIHTHAAANAFRLLLALEPMGYQILGETACRLTEDSLPNTDVCVFQKAIWNEAVRTNEYPTVAPALVVEVHSPSNRGYLHRKAELYLEHGAEQVWILYPKARRVWVAAAREEEDRGEARVGETVTFGGLTLAVSDLFA